MTDNLFGKIEILLVEDDPNLGFVVRDSLQDHDFHVVLAKDGSSGFQTFFQGNFDLCILDVMLPKKDGFTLAKEIRQIKSEVPIIFLTAKSMKDDKIQGYEAGADDYLSKPFEMEELLLRIQAVLRRTGPKDNSKKKDVFELGPYTFDYKNHQLSSELYGQSKLTRKEAELLRLLSINEGQTLERDVALKLIWGSDDYFLGRSMDVFISKLRKHFHEDSGVKINNVHGVGFKLVTNPS